MTWMRCRCLIGVSAALISSVGVALAQPVTTDLEQRAFRIGVEAATDARANQANAETVVAERYRRALALSADKSVQVRLKEAFTRGYQSGLSGAQPATALPPPPESPPAPALPARTGRIFNVTTAHDVGEQGPVRATDVFTPDTNAIVVWFRHEGLPPGTTITCDWFYEEPKPPLRITEARAAVGPSANSGHFSYELAPGKRWPAGRYRIELRVDNEVVAEARYRVQEAGAARPYVHPRHRYQIVPPAGWTMNDQVPTADVQMKSADGNALIEITSGPISERLDPVSYAAGWESKGVGPGQPLVAKRAGRAFNLNGEIAYAGIYTGQGVLVKVVFVGIPGRFFVCTGVFAADDFDRAVPAFDAVVQSLRPPQ